MSKYYTPTIDEIYVGFECEIRDITFDINTSIDPTLIIKSLPDRILYWRKTICDERDVLYPSLSIKYESIRVKILDKEDIEELGFVCTGYMSDGQESEYQMYVDDHHYYMISRHFDNNYEITYIKSYDGLYNEKVLFAGTVKNKSELKTLLKWLQIL